MFSRNSYKTGIKACEIQNKFESATQVLFPGRQGQIRNYDTIYDLITNKKKLRKITIEFQRPFWVALKHRSTKR